MTTDGRSDGTWTSLRLLSRGLRQIFSLIKMLLVVKLVLNFKKCVPVD